MNETTNQNIRYAFIKSIPVMCGYLFLGMAFGILAQTSGFSVIWVLLLSIFVYAGSMQFIIIPMLASCVSPLTMFLTTIFVNSRHLFYGLSFVSSFQKMRSKIYMIFSLTDETYSVLCACRSMDEQERHRDTWFWISLLDQAYWVIGSVTGALLGKALPVDFTGIDFAMTALFVVILLEQVLGKVRKTKMAAMTGGVISLVCLFAFGTTNFLLPSLVITVFLLSAGQVHEQKKGRHIDA